MANSKKPQARTTSPKRTMQPTENNNVDNNSDNERDDDEVEQLDNTANRTTPSGTERNTNKKPTQPIYDTPIRQYNPQSRKTITASPLYRTLTARFDKDYTGEQPAEHWIFNDTNYKQRGFI